MLRVWKQIRYIYYFGVKLFALNLFLKLFNSHINSSDVIYRILWKKHQAVIKYLLRYTDCYKELQFSDDVEALGEFVIWTMWWQGEDEAPECIRLCLNSIRQNADGHKVVVITKNNYQQYIELPDFVTEKFRQGKISMTHLSDIIRVNLLYTYGGLWIDGGILVTKKIELYAGNYYTLRSPQEKYFCISEKRWIIGICGGIKHYNLFYFLKEMFNLYWKTEESLIDYCWFDYYMYIFWLNDKKFKKDLDKLPIREYRFNDMLKYMNQEIDYTLLESLEEVTGYFRISWRNDLKKTVDGKLTFYGYFCDKYGVHSYVDN